MRVILVLILTFAQPVAASQPISESLVQCAQLFDLSNRQSGKAAMNEKGHTLKALAESYMQAAETQAQTEGQGDPAAYVAAMAKRKAQLWDGKGRLYVFSEEFRDWARYCRKLGRHIGVNKP
ncbi:hypothetical protein [Primorskyibacter sp. S187A]|uniref:hypothetical protein n=1 Tax=Primorskyibacter sp. S187A TaxID=3415130 RepID=UPI003C7AC1C2